MTYRSSEFIKHFFIYGLGLLLVNSIGFVLIPMYTRYLTTSEFGILEILNRCIEIFNIIFGAGLGITCLSLYSREDDARKKEAVVSTAIITLISFSILGAIVFYIFSDVLCKYFLKKLDHLVLFRMGSIIIISELCSNVPMAYIQAKMKSKMFVFISTMKFASIICLNILLVAVLHLKLFGVILGNMSGSLFFAVILILVTIKETGVQFDKQLLKKMLLFGTPFIPGGLFLFVLNSGDRFFIKAFLDSSTLGIYSLGYKIGTLVMIFILGPFLRIWGPVMFKLDKENENREIFGNYFTYIILTYCLIALPLAIFSEYVIMIVSGETYWQAYKVVPYVLLAYLFWAASSFFDSGFYITGKTFYKPFIMGFATALALFLYWLMIPKYGLLGGAYATVLAFFIFSCLTFFISNKIYPIKYPLKKFGYIIGTGIIFYNLAILFPKDSFLFGIFFKTFLSAAYPIVMLLLGVLEIKAVKTNLKSLVLSIPTVK